MISPSIAPWNYHPSTHLYVAHPMCLDTLCEHSKHIRSSYETASLDTWARNQRDTAKKTNTSQMRLIFIAGIAQGQALCLKDVSVVASTMGSFTQTMPAPLMASDRTEWLFISNLCVMLASIIKFGSSMLLSSGTYNIHYKDDTRNKTSFNLALYVSAILLNFSH